MAPRAHRRLLLTVLVVLAGLEVLYASVGESALQSAASQVMSSAFPSGYYCGDSRCLSPENAFTCSKDCRPRCGDRICSPGESSTCKQDCQLGGTCPNGVCELEEDATICSQDCAAGCGDQVCSETESELSCPTDCSPPPKPKDPVCGNGVCENLGGGDEDSISCPADCGTPTTDPPPPPPPPSVCGDGQCGLGESPCNCTADCGPVGNPAACACGNGICSAHESCRTCSRDCGTCPPPSGGICGNAVCEESLGEACYNCAADCGLCPMFDDTEPFEPPTDPADQNDGLDPAFAKHWKVNLSGEDYASPLEGDATRLVANPLADGEGRRNVVIRPAAGGAGTVLNTVAGSWNFFPAGVKAPNGWTVVCWNRFTGAPSGATHGSLPDPRQGVALICRIDPGSGFGPEQVVQPGLPAAWLVACGSNGAGQPTVTFQRDSFGTLMNTGKPGDGDYTVTFHP